MGHLRYYAPEGGNCITTDAPVFEDLNRIEEAIKSCGRCPVIEACRQQIGMIALGDVAMNAGVIAGDFYRWRAEAPKVSYDLPPLPHDPEQALAALRAFNRLGRLSGTSFSQETRPLFDKLFTGYAAKDAKDLAAVFGEQYNKAWLFLGMTLKRYPGSREAKLSLLSDEARVYPIADLLLRDMSAFVSLGLSKDTMVSFAMRHSPDYILSLKEKYVGSDISPRQFPRIIQHDVGRPEYALQNYLLRLQVMRQIFGKSLADYHIRLACISSQTEACVRKLTKLQDTYQQLMSQPVYSKYEPWMVMAVLSLAPARRLMRLSGLYTFFRAKQTSLQRSNRSGRTIEDDMADPTVNIEERYLQQDTVREALAGLSEPERQAVLWAFNLTDMLDSDIDEDVLCVELGCDNLEAYVQTVILPKLKPGSD